MVLNILLHNYPYDFKKGILWADDNEDNDNQDNDNEDNYQVVNKNITSLPCSNNIFSILQSINTLSN
jgi:hypothetical protein